MSKYCKITWVKHEWEQLTCFTEWGKERFCTRSRSLTQRFSKNTVSGRTTLVPSWRTRWVLCSYPRWLQRRTDWRVRIWVWIPVGPFGAVEECGKERGNQREQRGLPVIISPQFRLGCGHRWVASSLVSARLCGLRVEASLRRDCCSELCSHASGRWVQKRAGKGFFFSFMSRQYLFILLYHVVVLSAFGLEGCFHPVGLDGIEEENPTPLCCAVPHPDQRLQGGTLLALPRRCSWEKSDLIARGICKPSLCWSWPALLGVNALWGSLISLEGYVLGVLDFFKNQISM